VYVFFFFNEHNILYATGIFILAGVTDGLDGYIARKYNLVTKIGQMLDPLADKLMQITVIACFTVAGILPIWILTIIVAKESLMIIGGMVLYTRKEKIVIPADHLGKAATVLFYLAILLIAFDSPYGKYLIIITISLTLISFFRYLRLALRKMKERETGQQ